jgi:ATP-dependent Clp protease ATP-binding subunit ClpC
VLTVAVLCQAYGARPLRRAVTAIVEDPLAEALLHGRVMAGQIAVVDRLDSGTVQACPSSKTCGYEADRTA